jgi:ubiquinone/menaquinone biosynthesis C-methylase UbiE
MIKRIIKSISSERQRLHLWYWYFGLRGWFYLGEAYYCNYCKRSFRKFLPYGYVPRKNVACPQCNSLERTRLLKVFLERETQAFDPGIRILHFGPARMLEQALKKIHSTDKYYSVDPNPALADHKVDITEIPFPDNHFDLILCSHILAYVKDEQAALKEMFRVLKPGRMALVMSLIEKSLPHTIEHDDKPRNSKVEPGMLRLHGADFKERLQYSGVEVEEIDYRSNLSEEDQQKLCVGDGKRELIFVCRKVV